MIRRTLPSKTDRSITKPVAEGQHPLFPLYAAGLISVVWALFRAITPKASGNVVRPPTSAKATPAAFR